MKLKGALIGLGNIAVRGHVPAYADPLVRERIELVAVTDVVESNREKAAPRSLASTPSVRSRKTL